MKARTKLIFLGLVAAIFCALLGFIPFWFGNLTIPPLSPKILLFFLLVNLGACLIYLSAFKLIKQSNNPEKLIKIIILFTLVFSIILLLLPAIGSADIFNYIFRARVFTVYDKNPYLVTTADFPNDIFYDFSPKLWNVLPMQYGPPWAALSICFSFIAKNNFFWNQFLYKLLALLTNFGIIYFIYKIVSLIKPAYKINGLLLYAWNPLILFEVINNGHNDILLVFFMLAAIYFLLKKKYLFSLILLLFSILIKYVTLFLLPVFLIFIFKKIVTSKDRIVLMIKAGLIVVLITILFYLPFWSGPETLQGIFKQSKLMSFMNLSLFPSLLFGLNYSLSGLLHWSFTNIMQNVRYLGWVLFLIIYLWQLRLCLKIKTEQEFIYRNFLILFVYIIYAVFSLQPWYFLWALPLASLIDQRYFPAFILLITLTGLLSYTFIVISLISIITFVILFFGTIITKKNYFTPFLGWR